MSDRIVKQCAVCGANFVARRAAVRLGQFCSQDCKGKGQALRWSDPHLIAQRFGPLVDTNGPLLVAALGPCHVWKGHRPADGYGRFGFAGEQRLAHRVAFYLHHGRWPEPCALHHCDGGSLGCVRVDHLYEGTRTENALDRDMRRRTARGEDAGPAKLSEQQARELLAAFAGGESVPSVSRRTGINLYTLYDLRKGRTWTHLPR